MAATLEHGGYEGRPIGRWPKWTLQQQQTLRALANAEGRTAGVLLHHLSLGESQSAISPSTVKRYLKDSRFSYQRYRYSLKKTFRRDLRVGRLSDRLVAQARARREMRPAVC